MCDVGIGSALLDNQGKKRTVPLLSQCGQKTYSKQKLSKGLLKKSAFGCVTGCGGKTVVKKIIKILTHPLC